MKTVSERRPVTAVWFITSVGRLQHMSDICVTYWSEDELLRRIPLLAPTADEH
jgi:hypothetical protein